VKRMSEDVYEPREDSRLLAETAVAVCDEDDKVLDLGAGTGFVGEFVMDSVHSDVVCSDISRKSCLRAYQTNKKTVQGDMLRHIHTNTFDVVLFNPPYLPAEDAVDDFDRRALSYNSSGNIIKRFIDEVHRILKHNGNALILVSSKTGINDVVNYSEEKGFKVNRMLSIRVFYEELVVLNIS
jgi:release factor glutamine methyltransferase